jgi:tripartite ATP-independent transporter DctP family solute receptor
MKKRRITMKKTRSILSTTVIGLVLLAVSAPSFAGGDKEKSQSSAKKGEFLLNVGTVLTEKDPLYAGLLLFQKNVEDRTDGVVAIRLFASAQLGKDEDVLEQAKVGMGVGIITDPGRLSSYIADFGILGAPYLVDDYAGALKLLNTSVFKDFSDKFAKDGLKILAFNYYQGTRHLFTNKPAKNPQDLAGQRIRSSGSKIVTASVKYMGANPTVIPWSEAYTALQQKVIDGVEEHYSAALGISIFEVTKYLSKTAHFQLLTGLVVSNSWFEKLPEKYRKIVVEEAYNGGKYASELVVTKEKEFEQTLVKNGLQIVDCDVAVFKAAAEKTYDDVGYRALKDKIDVELGRK